MSHSLPRDSHAHLGCRHPICMTIILLNLHLFWVEKHPCLVLIEMQLRSVLVPGNLKEQNILVKARVTVLITKFETYLANTGIKTRKGRPVFHGSLALNVRHPLGHCLPVDLHAHLMRCPNSRMHLLRVGIQKCLSPI